MNRPLARRRLRVGAATGLTILAIDQCTKAVCTAPRGGTATGSTLPLRNAGALGGIGAGHGPLVGAVAVTVLVLMGARVVDWVRRGRLPAWTAGLLVGGAVSNLLDRIAFGNVRDFLVIGRLVVNVADLAVLIGIGVYCYATLQSRPRNARAVTGCASR